MTVADLIRMLAKESGPHMDEEVFVGLLSEDSQGEVFNVERVQRIRRTEHGVVLDLYPHPNIAVDELKGGETIDPRD